MAKEQKMTYKDAQEQLNIILNKLEIGEADIDELSILVKEASSLLKICKTKLRNAEFDVDKALASLDDDQKSQDDDINAS